MVLKTRQRSRDESGAVAVLVAVLTLVLFSLAAIVVDLGHGRLERRTAQSTADAAALAGGNALYPTGATTPDFAAAEAAVKAFAVDNGITSWSGCVDPTPLPLSSGTSCIFFQVTPQVAAPGWCCPPRPSRPPSPA